MMKKLQLLALFISLVSLLMLSACSVVDGITGNKDDDKIVTLHPVLLNGKWGYINNSGNMVINPDYDEAREFSDGYAAVRKGTTWGYVSEQTKKLTIPANFSVAGDFSEELAPAQLPGGEYGFINTSGDFVIDPQYDFAGAFSEGLAAVRDDGLWGYVATSGELSIDLKFSDARAFSEELAAVETFEGWVYINKTGSEVISPDFQVSAAGEFSDGLAPVQTTEGWGYINKTGNPIITPKYEEAGVFAQSRAWIREDDYVGFIDKSGENVIPNQFGEVKSFSEDMSAVRISSRWFFISRKSGRIVINEPFNAAESFSNGIARVQLGEDENTRFGYIDRSGKYIWYPTR